MFKHQQWQRVIATITAVLLVLTLITPVQTKASETPKITMAFDEAINGGPKAEFYLEGSIPVPWGAAPKIFSTNIDSTFTFDYLDASWEAFNQELWSVGIVLKSYDTENYVFEGWSINENKPILEGDAAQLGFSEEIGIDTTEYLPLISSNQTIQQITDYQNRQSFPYDLFSELKKTGEKFTSVFHFAPSYDNPLAENITITPVFKEIESEKAKFQLDIQKVEEGTVSAFRQGGDTWTFITSPKEGYVFSGWHNVTTGEKLAKTELELTLTEHTTLMPIFEKGSIVFDDKVGTSRESNGYSGDPLFVGQRGYVFFDLSVKGNYLTNKLYPMTFKVYEGADTTGRLLGETSQDFYGTSTPSSKITKYVIIDPMIETKQVTITGQIEDGPIVEKTYSISAEPSQTMDLTYLYTPSNAAINTTFEGGPDIFDVTSFVDEQTGELQLYAGAYGGVLKLKGNKFEYMPGLKLTTAGDGLMGSVYAIGGTKDHLYAVTTDYPEDGSKNITLYEYTPALGEWKHIEHSKIEGFEDTYLTDATVIAADDIWTTNIHWNGEKWESHAYKFSRFVKSVNGQVFAQGQQGIYKYNKGTWELLHLGSGRLQNIGLKDQIAVMSDDGHFVRDKSGNIEYAANVESIMKQPRLADYLSVDRNGDYYIFERDRQYNIKGVLVEGASIYKFNREKNKWEHQHVPAFWADNEPEKWTQQFITDKVRPTTVERIYNLSKDISIYAGRGGAIYADFDKTTITFDSNGGSVIAPLTAKINSVQEAPTPTKEGQHFVGWYLDEELTKAYSFDYMPAKDLQLFAKWGDKPVDLTQAKATANETIEQAYKKYNKREYDDEGWSALTKAKTEGLATIAALTGSEDEVKAATNKVLAAMNAVAVSENMTVAVSMEKFTLGQGYIIEPTLVTVPRKTQASVVITDLLVDKYGDNPLPYKMTGSVKTNFYLAHVLDDGYKGTYNIPAYIMKAIEEDGSDFSLDNDEWLGEFDFFKNSGWMYAVNNAFPGVGAAGWTLENDQVMRWQYTIYGLGADLNANNEQWGAQSLIKTAQKDNLTWRVAEINSLSAEEKKAFLAKDDNQAHYDNAYKVLTNMESTQAEVDAVLKALGGTERVGEEVKVEMPEEAQVINDAIKALPENITLTSKDAVEKVRKQYEALDETLKQWIWKDEMAILEAAEKKIATLIAQATEVEKNIETLPTADKIKLTDEDKFYEVQTAYIGLSSDQQKLVSNAKKLIELMTKLEQLKDEQVTVEKVIEQITALPKVEDLKLTDEAAVTKVQAAYNKLTKDDQSKVTNAKTLTALVEKLAQLKASDNQKLASDVVTLINGLPSLSTVKLTNESTIQAVKTAYDNLSADAKKLVTNVFILNAVVAKLNELKQEETDKATATKVTTLINNLPASASITLANKLNVSNARTNYNALTTTQKALILNLAKLIEAEAKITELEVNVKALVTEIAALPNAKDITSNHEKLVKILRDTYNSLATTQKAEVTNYTKLVEIEAALAKLQKTDGEPKVDEEKLEVPQKLEEALATAEGIQSVKETNDILIITSKTNTTNVVLPNAFIEQIRTNKYETVQIESTNGVKIAISNSFVNDILSKKSSLEVVVEQQKQGLDVALVEVLSNGIKRELTTAGNYTKVTMPLNVLTGGTVASSKTVAIARLVDGEYKAVPHRIVNDEAIIYMNEAATYVAVNETVTFKDIEKIGARADIEFLASRYVVYGTTESTYTPNKNITRAQFGVMIARALNLTATEETSIQDIKGKNYENEIQALHEAGITKVDNKFNPNAPLTREHAAAFMYRVMEYIQKEEVEAVKVSTFKDKASIGKEYMTAVATLQALEIMEGSNGKFSPKAHLTRAQMAKILRRTLEEVNMM